MSHTTKRILVARLLLGLSTAPAALLIPTAASAGTAAPSTKAQIEHAEQLAASSAAPSTKAQIEHAERTSASAVVTSTAASNAGRTASVGTSHGPVGNGGDAAAWQLALSAALGAAVTGGALVTARQVAQHRRPLAS